MRLERFGDHPPCLTLRWLHEICPLITSVRCRQPSHAAPGFSGLLENQTKAFRREWGCHLKEKVPSHCFSEDSLPTVMPSSPCYSPAYSSAVETTLEHIGGLGCPWPSRMGTSQNLQSCIRDGDCKAVNQGTEWCSLQPKSKARELGDCHIPGIPAGSEISTQQKVIWCRAADSPNRLHRRISQEVFMNPDAQPTLPSPTPKTSESQDPKHQSSFKLLGDSKLQSSLRMSDVKWLG